MTQLLAKTNISPTPDTDTARTALGNMWDVLYEAIQAPEIDITCAATLDVGGQLSSRLRLTGTPVPITSFGTNYRGPIVIRSSNTYTINHNGTTLICTGGWNLTVQAGDTLIASPKSSTSGVADGWQVGFLSKADGSGFFNFINIIGSNPIYFEGATQNAFSTKIAVVDPTANRTVTIPNADVDLTNVRDATTALKGVTRLANSTDVLSYIVGGYSNSTAVTPASLAAVRNYSNPGYQKLPGGLLMQWGIHGPWNKDTWGDINFPTTFTGGVFAIATTNMHADTGNQDVGFRLISYTQSLFRVRCEAYSNTSSTDSHYMHYITLGWAY